MKIILQDSRRFTIRLDKDEEVLSSLLAFAKEQKLASAYFSAIGTASMVELGYFNAFLKDYHKKPFLDNLEIISLTGNIAQSGGEPAIHAHGSFSTNEFGLVGGHVFKAVTLATCEIFLIAFDQPMQRAKNEEWGLNLLT